MPQKPDKGGYAPDARRIIPPAWKGMISSIAAIILLTAEMIWVQLPLEGEACILLSYAAVMGVMWANEE